MYNPAHFSEARVDVIADIIRTYPFATLITHGSNGIDANHIPFELELEPEPAPFGTLRGHVSRANPVWREHAPEVEALVIFQGPQAYISPSWYETKKETGKVVPTWNYIAVHAYGILRVVEDRDWLRGLVERLTDRHESGRPEPWRISDAPPDYLDSMLRAIVGIEIAVTRWLGKWKLSQNRSAADRAGVAAGLAASGAVDGVAMAAAIETI